MLVVRYGGVNRGLELKEEDIALLEEGDILIKVMAVGVCATDGKILLGKRNVKTGLVLGHEIAGEVVEKKGKVEGYEIGDRVSIFPGVACKRCYYCLNNYQNICISKVSFGLQIDGGFQQFMKVPAYIVKNGNALKLSSELSYEEGSFLEPISCCIESIDLVNVKDGDSILIIGAGVMGLLHLIILKDKASKIIISDLRKDRRDIALELGAYMAVDPITDNIKNAIMEETNGIGIDKCFICADSPDLVEFVCELVRRRGVINLFASSIKDLKFSVDPNILHYKEIILTGSHSSTLNQFYNSLEILRKELKIDKLITHKLPLEQFREAIDLYLKQEAVKVIIKPN